MENMRMYSSRWGNPLRGSQVAVVRESSYGKYRVTIQNAFNEPRPLSRNARPFRNITNLSLKHSHNEAKPKRVERTRNSNNLLLKPVMNHSFGTLQSGGLLTSKEFCATKSGPQECAEYSDEIYKHLRVIEREYKVDYNYMKSQKEITTTMRAILIDWLVDVNVRFKFRPETLFLTVNVLDRYLQREQVTKSRLQLVGVAAVLIASKYEEIYPPKIKHFIHTTNNAYDKRDVLLMESKILSTLQFKLNAPSSNRFLQEFNKVLRPSKKTSFLAQFLLELSLLESVMLKYSPSLTAASALSVAQKVANDSSEARTKQITGYTDIDLCDCKRDMTKILRELPRGTLTAVKRKFLSVKCMEVAHIKVSNSNR
eukprot:TRINITY_DN334_c0_g1_i14.p1 TRINITY_DN334_c0_g1~~TRINITY_DN334_c0_g1_i14.p1  ORF type:complete len:369 (+),score=76.82 TRINITY_DN334_c0_g1_i14:94-1200(+)